MSDEPTGATPTPIVNPYAGIDIEISAKATAVTSKSDLSIIKGVYPTRGAVQSIINMFLKSVVDELKLHNATYYTPENEQLFFDIIRRRTASSVD